MMAYDYEKIAFLRKQMAAKMKKLNAEKDYYERQRLKIEIKILDLKIDLERIVKK